MLFLEAKNKFICHLAVDRIFVNVTKLHWRDSFSSTMNSRLWQVDLLYFLETIFDEEKRASLKEVTTKRAMKSTCFRLNGLKSYYKFRREKQIGASS